MRRRVCRERKGHLKVCRTNEEQHRLNTFGSCSPRPPQPHPVPFFLQTGGSEWHFPAKAKTPEKTASWRGYPFSPIRSSSHLRLSRVHRAAGFQFGHLQGRQREDLLDTFGHEVRLHLQGQRRLQRAKEERSKPTAGHEKDPAKGEAEVRP